MRLSPPDGETLREEKQALRLQVGLRIRAMERRERREKDIAICARILPSLAKNGGDAVVGYLSIADEVRIDEALCRIAETGTTVLLPRWEQTGIRLVPWCPAGELRRSANKILEPVGRAVRVSDWKALRVLVPGRAFDERGHRVGRGAGAYDRFLSSLPEGGAVIGVGYECQMFAALPYGDHDVRLGVVITETSVRYVSDGE